MTDLLGAAARLVNQDGQQWYRAPALSIVPEIVHGLTHSALGNFSLTTDPDAEAVHARRGRVLEAAGLGHARLLAPRLHHSANVAIVRDGRAPEGEHDALIAADGSTALAVTVADCVPVYFVDVVGGAFGVAHAGWRGLAGGIVKNVVTAMVDDLAVRTGNLLVGTGPAIRGPSYVVGPEVAARFPETFSVPVGHEGRAQLDLPSCALAQAAAARVPRDNLIDFSLDTFARPDDLFSHRRGDRGRHWAFIGRT
ncbi:MAG TPA: polyphenol oxidase family protein [bacterium]|nr:polyphenol oxidase family protein [bacterium]